MAIQFPPHASFAKQTLCRIFISSRKYLLTEYSWPQGKTQRRRKKKDNTKHEQTKGIRLLSSSVLPGMIYICCLMYSPVFYPSTVMFVSVLLLWDSSGSDRRQSTNLGWSDQKYVRVSLRSEREMNENVKTISQCWIALRPPFKFHRNLFCSFYVILQRDKTNRETNRHEWKQEASCRRWESGSVSRPKTDVFKTLFVREETNLQSPQILFTII